MVDHRFQRIQWEGSRCWAAVRECRGPNKADPYRDQTTGDEEKPGTQRFPGVAGISQDKPSEGELHLQSS